MQPTEQTEQTSQQVFDAAYWASKAPAVQALQTAGAGRLLLAQQLVNAGYLLDFDIDILGNDPYNINTQRLLLGIAWVPSAGLQPLGAVPGYALPNLTPLPGQLPYPTTMPAGWIAVSTSVAAYPPFVPPPAPTVTVYTLGPQIAKGVYAVSSSTGTFPPVGQSLVAGGITGTLATYGPFNLYVIEVG